MSVDTEEDGAMEVDQQGGVDLDTNPVAIERVLGFGRDLQALYSGLTASKPNEPLKTMLQVQLTLPIVTLLGVDC